VFSKVDFPTLGLPTKETNAVRTPEGYP